MLHNITRLTLPAAVGLVCSALATGTATAQESPPAPPTPPDAEVERPDSAAVELARGPIHEALAQPYVADPEPGLIIRAEPPEPIDEVPPDVIPEGENVTWIPGYWAWDDIENRFLWVSGLWRDLPPGQQWVPGSWVPVNAGYQWITGFYTVDRRSEVKYLPFPPESQERGPTYEAPGDNYFWVPGCWLWHDNDYAWRPGYWAEGHFDWVWVPNRYVWTPRGVIFVAGYWDYPLRSRGLVFAPVFFSRPVWRNPRFYYTPTVVLDWNSLLVHLFVRPRYNHYYVGDYYGDRYADFGFRPWYSYGRAGVGYDPLLTYFRWSSRGRGFDFVDRMRGWHDYYVRHEDARPPHRHRDLQQRVARARERDLERSVLNNLTLTRSLREVTDADGEKIRRGFRRMQESQQEILRERTRQLRDVQQRRRELERTLREEIDRRGGRPGGEDARDFLRLPERRDGRLFDEEQRRGRDGRPDVDDGRRRPQVPRRPDADRSPRAGADRPDIERPGRERRPGREGGVRTPGRDRSPRATTRPGDARPRPRETPRPGRRPDSPRRPRLDAPDRPGAERPRTERPQIPSRPDAGRGGARPKQPGGAKVGAPRPNPQPPAGSGGARGGGKPKKNKE